MSLHGSILKGNYGYYRIGNIIGGRQNSKVSRGEIISERPIPCAIKETTCVFKSESEKIQATNRFNKDAQTIIRLNHPDFVEVIDYFSDGDNHYFVMELIEGMNLESLLNRQHSPFSEREVVELGILICRALYYLHIQKPPVVFGNIRPRHIIKMGNDKIKLVEFGLASHFKSYDEKSPYISPEFSLKEGRVNPLSDLYSLGCTLYELCTGSLPDAELSMIRNISLELGVVIEKATASDPTMRYRSAKEMKEALLDCLKNPEISRG